MTPTVVLAFAATVATIRSGRVRGLAPAARAICTFLLLDVYHHACRPLLDARRAGAALSSDEVWALRLDAWILAGGWCAVAAWLLTCEHGHRSRAVQHRWHEEFMASVEATSQEIGGACGAERRAPAPRRGCAASHAWACGLVYGVVAAAMARAWPASWTPLLIAPRFAVGALAWATKGRGPGSIQGHCQGISPIGAHEARGRRDIVPPSLLIGQIIAACQVGSAAFLWSQWGDVRIQGGKSPQAAPTPEAPTPAPAAPVATPASPAPTDDRQLDLLAWRPKPRPTGQLSLFGEPAPDTDE